MNRNEAIKFLFNQSTAVFQGMPFDEPVDFDWMLCGGAFVKPGFAQIELHDVFGDESLKVVNYDHIVFDPESLQSRIETLFGFKFETEEKLIEAIGSLWGNFDIRIDNRSSCQVSHRRLPDGVVEVQVAGNPEVYGDVSESYGKTLKNELDLVAAVYDLIPYRKVYQEIKDIICKAGAHPQGELVTDSIRRLVEHLSDYNEIAVHLAKFTLPRPDETASDVVKRFVVPAAQAKDDFETRVTHLLLNNDFMSEGENTFEAIHKLITREQSHRPATSTPKSARHLMDDLGQLLCSEFDTEKELAEHLAEMKVRAQEFGQVMTLLTNHGVMRFDETNVLKAVGDLLNPKKTYWDGEETLRVGHIIKHGVEVVEIKGSKVCLYNAAFEELYVVEFSDLEPHPFAKYSDEQRAFLEEQIEKGVIKLC